MTNSMIILMESVRYMEKGILKGTGEFITVDDGKGGMKKLEMPETIHTYNKWKELGYQVRKGEHSKIKFSVWKYHGRVTHDEETDQEIETGKCFMKMSAFFTRDQVDAIV